MLRQRHVYTLLSFPVSHPRLASPTPTHGLPCRPSGDSVVAVFVRSLVRISRRDGRPSVDHSSCGLRTVGVRHSSPRSVMFFCILFAHSLFSRPRYFAAFSHMVAFWLFPSAIMHGRILAISHCYHARSHFGSLCYFTAFSHTVAFANISLRSRTRSHFGSSCYFAAFAISQAFSNLSSHLRGCRDP